MATDDADRRAKEVVDAELWLGCDYLPVGVGEEHAVERSDRAELARQIAAAIRAAVEADRRRICAVLNDALPGADDLLRRIREGTQ